MKKDRPWGDTTQRDELLKQCIDRRMPPSLIAQITAPMLGKTNEEKEAIAKKILERMHR